MSYHYPMPPRVAGGGPATRAIRAVREQHREAERRAELRAELCSIIDRAISLLDAMDGDADLEADQSVYLGGGLTFCTPCEDEGAPSGDFEPSLGWTRTGALGGDDDRENALCADCDGGEVPFLPPCGLPVGALL